MTNSLLSRDLVVSSFQLQKNGLTPVGKPTFEEWVLYGQLIKDAEQSVQFWIGDWLLFGEKTYGKVRYEQTIQQTGLDYQTLRTYKYVASHVPMLLRSNKLSYYHHREVANLEREKQAHLLTKAVTLGWPLLKLRQEKYRLNLEAARTGANMSQAEFLLGDCTKLLETIPDNSLSTIILLSRHCMPIISKSHPVFVLCLYLDLLLTDPPYGIDYETEHREVNPLRNWKMTPWKVYYQFSTRC